MGVIRKTKAIKTLLNIFENNHTAVLATNLVTQLKDEMNKTTVYRALDRLEEDGVVHSFLGSDGLKWYAKCTSCTSDHHHDVHPHFQCNICKKVTCIPLDINIPSIENYTIEKTAVFLTGKCKDCIAN